MSRLIFILIIFISLSAGAQPLATQFKQANDAGISKEQLDATYPVAINVSEPDKSVFNGQEKRFQLNYVGMLKSLSAFLGRKVLSGAMEKQNVSTVYILARTAESIISSSIFIPTKFKVIRKRSFKNC